MYRPQIVKRVTFQLISLVAISFYMAGCSLFGPRNQSIGVSSDPPGLRLSPAGNLWEQPLFTSRRREGENMLIEVQKSGYQTQYRTLSRRMSTLGILDIVGGAIWLVPFLGLLSSAASEFEPAEIGITLEPEQKVAPTH